MSNKYGINKIINKFAKNNLKPYRNQLNDRSIIVDFGVFIIDENLQKHIIDVQGLLLKVDLKPLFNELKNHLDNFELKFYIDVYDLTNSTHYIQADGQIETCQL